jgi:TPR repeat protein
MERAMNAPFAEADAWRVAAMSMMRADELRAVLGGNTALPWVTAAARSGLVEAQLRIGRMRLSGDGVAKDEAEALSWFIRAAETGNAEAHNMIGRCFENGWGTGPDAERAATHYAVAARAGDAWAQYNLGHLFLDGIGVPRDRDEAFRWYGRAAEQGHVRAMNLVARCAEEGWGCAKDHNLAREWYRRSAEGGYFRGAYNYATILLSEGCTVGAAVWFRRAIEMAPEPTRGNMLAALSHSPDSRLNNFAARFDPRAGSTEGLV